MGYDEWLERPYMEQAERDERWEAYCEAHPEEDEDEVTDEDVQNWLDMMEEDAAISAYEGREADKRGW